MEEAKVTLESRPVRREGAGHFSIWGKAFQAEGLAEPVRGGDTPMCMSENSWEASGGEQSEPGWNAGQETHEATILGVTWKATVEL